MQGTIKWELKVVEQAQCRFHATNSPGHKNQWPDVILAPLAEGFFNFPLVVQLTELEDKHGQI